jgi:hypothetical protein
MLGLLLVIALVSPAPTNNCAQYFHDWCIGAVDDWLPSFADSSDFWDSAAHVALSDSFPNALLRAHILYDPQHRVVLYVTGCCGWSQLVVAYASPPPATVMNGNFASLRTSRGIQLGMSRADVIRIYGDTKPQSVPHHPDVRVLAYTTLPPRNSFSKAHRVCGQFDNFYFRDDRLILIQLGSGC